MLLRHLAVICSLLICVYSKSFTLVVDTTYSMQDEISMIRTRIKPLVESIGNASSIENYVIVPFNDPDVGPAQIFTAGESFLKYIDSLTVSGGRDIPENSLSGLQKALQESRPESDIFLFTDACAKDEAKFDDIERLCRITRSKVIVFMSGTCPISERRKVGNLETYNQVTKVCFGNVFQLDLNNYGQAFRFMTEIVRDGYNDVKTFELVSGYRQLPVPVDSLTRDVIVSVSGDMPSLQLFDESGHSPRTEVLIETRQLEVVRIVGPHRGQYHASVSSQGLISVTIYKRSECPLAIGFSPLHPRSIEETTSSPLPGRESFIFVLVPMSYEYKLGSLTIHMLNKDSQRTVNLMESQVSARVYISKAYFEPGCIFRMTVSGIDKVSSEPVQIISKTLESQKEVATSSWSAAVIDSIIPATSLTDYKKNATVACKVIGYPQPTIWWEDEDGQKMAAEDSLLQYPATYISYVSVPNIKENQTLTCKASTETGSDSKSTDLYVYRPYVFQMIKTPKDITIEYEAEGKLYCEVNAYPEAVIKWYHNDKTVVFTTNEAVDDDSTFNRYDEVEYFQEDNALVIRNMTSKYVGTYTCDVRNGANAVSYPVEVKISGLEVPVLEMSETELTTHLGDEFEIACRISKGRPNPTVTWNFKPAGSYDFTDLPKDIEIEEEKIAIGEAKSEHNGIYKCEAINEQGKDSREIKLRVIYAPKIENAETTTQDVLLGKMITLECSVDAEPKAAVRWERADGTYFPDENHILEGNSLKFEARYNDSGSYRCIAENEAGIAEKTVNVNVLVPPYITSVVKNVNVWTGDSLTLSCRVEEANPPPTITWKFIGLDNVMILLNPSYRNESIFLSEYVIRRASRAQSGKYICYANNSVGFDVVEVAVNVK
ncbi:hemicentin-1-like [Cydia pomonella]|uniref:hemicentin-1-like n=1 Tax=Cydia pomonella TaxID=82600 RepID=UPI002ADE40E3|nr:hemicentin-1-like [Cydia pomonella]